MRGPVQQVILTPTELAEAPAEAPADVDRDRQPARARAAAALGAAMGLVTAAVYFIGAGRSIGDIDASVTVGTFVKTPSLLDPLRRTLDGLPRVHLIEPPDYVPFVKLMQRATLILTDSGGVQEEAPTLGVPILVLRQTTERPEGVDAGTAMLIGTDSDRIVTEATRLLTDPVLHARMARATNPYGDGRAAEQIVRVLKETATPV